MNVNFNERGAGLRSLLLQFNEHQPEQKAVKSEPLFSSALHVQAHHQAVPTNVEDAAAGNVNAIRHLAYAEGYRDGKAFMRHEKPLMYLASHQLLAIRDSDPEVGMVYLTYAMRAVGNFDTPVYLFKEPH